MNETMKRKEAVRPVPPLNRRAYKALNWFHDTPKTESAMYLRFQMMPDEYLKALKAFYNRKMDMDIFSLICKWWAVKWA